MPPSVFLSILIPVYNWDIKELLTRLASQIEQLPAETKTEIVIIDDCSSMKFVNSETANRLPFVQYSELPVNKGRAAIRNLLLQQARGKYVLYLDADMLPDKEDFLRSYLQETSRGKAVVCGGISYQQCSGHDDPQYSFYLYKSKRTEALAASVRKKAPWRYLFTSNILLRREIMESIPFNSAFSGYGYEDIEWGIRLGKSHQITHIDNSCSHMGVMDKSVVYLKMVESISNYKLLLDLHPECQQQTGAGVYAARLQLLSVSGLKMLEKIFSRLFYTISWNKALLLIFQLDKALLLAISMKNDPMEGRPVE